MNNKRAREIATSPIMANVTYNGSKVYIENVNEDTNTATIHLLTKPQCRHEVSISTLIEH